MNTPLNPDDHELEQRVGRVLRGLPPRSAPPTLETRVQRELTRRAMRPWWRRSFAHWPAGARAAFVAASVAVATAMLVEGNGLWSYLSWRDLQSPPRWISECLAAGGLFYVLLFGLGVAAYRALYLDSPAKVMT